MHACTHVLAAALHTPVPACEVAVPHRRTDLDLPPKVHLHPAMHCTAQSLTLVAYFQTIVHGSQRSHLSGSQPARQGCTDWVEQNAQGKEVSSQSQSFLGGPAMAREAGRSGDSHVTMQGQVPDGAF